MDSHSLNSLHNKMQSWSEQTLSDGNELKDRQYVRSIGRGKEFLKPAWMQPDPSALNAKRSSVETFEKSFSTGDANRVSDSKDNQYHESAYLEFDRIEKFPCEMAISKRKFPEIVEESNHGSIFIRPSTSAGSWGTSTGWDNPSTFSSSPTLESCSKYGPGNQSKSEEYQRNAGTNSKTQVRSRSRSRSRTGASTYVRDSSKAVVKTEESNDGSCSTRSSASGGWGTSTGWDDPSTFMK